MTMEAIKLGLKKRKKKGYYNSAMKTEKKNSKEPKSALIPCGERLYFSFIY